MKSTGSCTRLKGCTSPTSPASSDSRGPGGRCGALCTGCAPEQTWATLPDRWHSQGASRRGVFGGRQCSGDLVAMLAGARDPGGGGGDRDRHPGLKKAGPGFCHRGRRATWVEGDFHGRMGNEFPGCLSQPTVVPAQESPQVLAGPYLDEC